ncbi:hypothetical protein FPOAC1_012263 [Fusarium poae]|uniref:hypothetical protein n=1 Tax=Fusarium poae TaxID=36050 RepID=UPI001CEBC86C|nr:hypothetical protein FPOAC1_012263 [Fusarium poae]KAG8667432.1 hypothetical protein FPOAC1_012263 [Fusarium poae]
MLLTDLQSYHPARAWHVVAVRCSNRFHTACAPKKAKKDAKPWLTKGPRRTEASQVSGARASLWSSVSHFKSKKARNVNTTRDVTLRQK